MKTLFLWILTITIGCFALLLVPLLIGDLFFYDRSMYPKWYEREYHRLEKEMLNQIEAKYQLRTTSLGGSFINDIHNVSYGFTANRDVDRDQARVLLVQLMEEIKSSINRLKELRPYLSQYPMNEKQIGVWIIFRDSATGETCMPPYISGVASSFGRINYDEGGIHLHLDFSKFDETYPEAKSKVDAYLAEQKKQPVMKR